MINKIDDNNIEVIEQVEDMQKYNKEDLLREKQSLVDRMQLIDDILALF